MPNQGEIRLSTGKTQQVSLIVTNISLRVLSPEALRGETVAAAAEIADDAETPSHTTTDKDEEVCPPVAAIVGLAGDHRVESTSRSKISLQRKRRRVGPLSSSSDEDEEDVRSIKPRGKEGKEDVGRKKLKLTAVNCRVENLQPSPLSVAPQAGTAVSPQAAPWERKEMVEDQFQDRTGSNLKRVWGEQ